jgi:hypothetical protein
VSGFARRPDLVAVRALVIHAGPQLHQFLPRLRRVHPCQPIRRQFERRCRQQILPIAVVTPCEASPSPVLGPSDEPRAQGITLYVAHDREQVSILLDRKSLEAALPDTSRRLSSKMVAMTVGGE